MSDKWGDNGKTGRIDPFEEIYDVSDVPAASTSPHANIFFDSSFSS